MQLSQTGSWAFLPSELAPPFLFESSIAQLYELCKSH